ncbi:MAG: DUF4358 domain-containing protein [Lachnospiraceae bacterium]|nr:DUF4358 domain-containing protein [Lachnospiraceae bacterium]
MKKKALLGILSGMLVCGAVLTGCGKESAQQETPSTEVITDEQVVVEETNTDTQEEVVEEPAEGQGETEEEVEETVPEEETQEAVVVKTPTEIYADICAAVSLKAPMELEDGFIMNLFGIDVSLLEDYVFSISEESISAETIVIAKVKDEKDAKTIAMSVEVYRGGKAVEMENYLPEQYEIVEKASVTTDGSYVYLVISESQKDIEDIIVSGLGK